MNSQKNRKIRFGFILLGWYLLKQPLSIFNYYSSEILQFRLFGNDFLL